MGVEQVEVKRESRRESSTNPTAGPVPPLVSATSWEPVRAPLPLSETLQTLSETLHAPSESLHTPSETRHTHSTSFWNYSSHFALA